MQKKIDDKLVCSKPVTGKLFSWSFNEAIYLLLSGLEYYRVTLTPTLFHIHFALEEIRNVLESYVYYPITEYKENKNKEIPRALSQNLE